MPRTITHNLFLQTAHHHYQTADHLLSVTYPLVKESKLLVAIVESLNLCTENIMNALIAFHHHDTKTPQSPESQWGYFQSKITPHYHLSQEYISLIITLREITKQHRHSTVEFSREGKRILCSEEYKLRILTPKEVKEYIAQCKQFLNSTNIIITQTHRKA